MAGILYNTITGMNAAPITDPYYDKILRGWMPEGLILQDLFPKEPSGTYKGRIPKQNTAVQIRSNFTLSPDGFPMIKLDFEAKDTYLLRYRGFTASLDYADVEELGGDALAAKKTLAILNANVLVGREYAVAAFMTDTTKMLQYINVPVQWSDATANILSDITSAISAVRTGVNSQTGCGYVPNVAIVPWEVFNVLTRHPALIKAAYFGATNPGSDVLLAVEKLKAIFAVDKILIPKVQYMSNDVGATTARTDVWGKNVILARIDYSPTPAEAKQSFGYTFVPSSPAVGLADFSYTWMSPGILPEMGKNVTNGFMADDRIVDITCACLLPNVIA
jgi:hypothetical protein